MNPTDRIATLSLLDRRAALLRLMELDSQELFFLCLHLGIRPGVSKINTTNAIMDAVEEQP